MSIENEFKSEVRAHLEPLIGPLIPLLSQLIAYKYPDEVVTLVFEVFPRAFTECFPVRAFFMDADSCEFFVYRGDEGEFLSPIDSPLLDIDHVYSDGLRAQFRAKNENLDTCALASAELIEWFSKCWSLAGGDQFSRKAIIRMHDGMNIFYLNNNVRLGGSVEGKKGGVVVATLERQFAFTLIELMVTVAIIGILAAIAYPSYHAYIIKSNRTEAQAHLMDIAQRQQQYFFDSRSYAATISELNLTTPDKVARLYNIIIVPKDGLPPGFAVTATPKPTSVQLRDGSLTINSTGEKTPADKW